MSPGPLHEVLIELLRHVPEHLTPALARAVPDLEPGLPVTLMDPAASVPLVVDRRADLVMVFGDAAAPRLVVVVEIQLARDPEKHWSWPQYVVAMHQRWACPVELLVIAPDPKVAAWARQPIRLNGRGSQIVPLVLGTEDFPRLSLEELAGRPHASVFHALLHCRGRKDLPLLEQAVEDLQSLPEPDRIGYTQILRSCLFPSFLELAEVAMSLEHTRFYQELVERLKAEGEELGRKAQLIKTISRLLGRRVALPGADALAKMEELPLEALEQLAEDLLDFNEPQDLEAWLARH